jgi:flagellar biogenesis protein FliO
MSSVIGYIIFALIIILAYVLSMVYNLMQLRHERALQQQRAQVFALFDIDTSPPSGRNSSVIFAGMETASQVAEEV